MVYDDPFSTNSTAIPSLPTARASSTYSIRFATSTPGSAFLFSLRSRSRSGNHFLSRAFSRPQFGFDVQGALPLRLHHPLRVAAIDYRLLTIGYWLFGGTVLRDAPGSTGAPVR